VELKHLVDTIAVGNSSATVMAAINEREARLREITNQVIEPGPESLQEKLEELRTFAVLRLTRLRERAGGGKWTERLPVHFEWLAEACEHSEKVARKALQLLLTFRRGSHRPLHKSSMIRLPL
jgi:hypothetical protein